MKKVGQILLLAAILVPMTALADDGQGKGLFAIGTALTIGLAALGGTFAQGKALSSGLDSIGRNPGAQGKIFIPMIVGLALIESLVVLSFVVANNLLGKF